MRKVHIITGFLFITLLGLGAWISSHRILWNDEYYSLVSSVTNTSYSKILSGGVSEGNNSPLFYALLKLQCDVFSYHPPKPWMDGHWGGVYVFDQFFLRIQSVIFMSAALCALFFYFYRRNSLLIGLYALAVTLTSSLFWFHWTEARPYAEWFALTTFQILILLNMLESPMDKEKKAWVYLGFIHCLLAFISFISSIQILAAGIVLGIFHRCRPSRMIPLVLVPLGICIFYYLHAAHYPFFFVDGPVSLISANVPKERLFIILMAAAILAFQGGRKGWAASVENKYLIFFILMLGAYGLVLLKLKYTHVVGWKGFQVSSRYFLSLLPAGIVGTVLFSDYFVRAYPGKIWKVVAVVILLCFLIFRFHKTSFLF
jgi:hypothetical protein